MQHNFIRATKTSVNLQISAVFQRINNDENKRLGLNESEDDIINTSTNENFWITIYQFN